jgi:tetratricopeptide (TPR) repeat protein
LNRDDEAIAIYEELLSFEKEKPEIYLYLASTYIHKKDYGKAEGILKDAIGRFPDNDDLLFNLSIVFEKTGRFNEMDTCLKKVIDLNPEHAEALNYLGYSYADKGIHLEDAYSLIQRALALKPESGYIMDSLGWVYYKSGKYPEALEMLLKASEIVKDDPTILEHIGDVYLAIGVTEKAQEYWAKSLGYHEKGEDEGLKERVVQKIKEVGYRDGKTGETK